jgi:hypothetical protein
VDYIHAVGNGRGEKKTRTTRQRSPTQREKDAHRVECAAGVDWRPDGFYEKEIDSVVHMELIPLTAGKIMLTILDEERRATYNWLNNWVFCKTTDIRTNNIIKIVYILTSHI